MKTAAFDYHLPSTVADAVATLAQFGDEVKVLAGGQSLVPIMAMRLGRPEHIVDINRIGELGGATSSGGTLRVGALTRHRDLERDALIRDSVPLLARAVPWRGAAKVSPKPAMG